MTRAELLVGQYRAMTVFRRLSLGLAATSCLLPSSAAVAHATATTPQLAGHLAYITSAGVLDVVDVFNDGTTSSPQQLAPITTAQSPNTVKATNLVVSGDGSRLAWSEVTSKPDPTYGSIETGATIVVRNMSTGRDVTLRSESYLLGFSGHRLVVTGAHTYRLVMTPSPHLERIHDGNAYAVATYPKGIVDVASSVGGTNSAVETDRLRLTTFGGHHTLLHTYKVGTSYRSAAANIDAVSGDGAKLLAELGNHQDFEGLGPSSSFDSFTLDTASHARARLGHYGTNAAKWRLAGAAFAGPHNTPWLALHSGYTRTSGGLKVRGVVVHYSAGTWQEESNAAIAVTGNRAGWVVIQAGEWDPVMSSPDGEYAPQPTLEALLEGPHGFRHTLAGIGGTQLLWVG